MRILIAISNLSPPAGGASKAVPSIARRIARRRHEFTTYTTNFDAASDLDVRLGEPVTVDDVEICYHRVYFLRFWGSIMRYRDSYFAGGNSQLFLRRCTKPIFLRLPFKPLFVFLYSYVLNLGSLDGRGGLDFAIAPAMQFWQVDLKYRELLRNRGRRRNRHGMRTGTVSSCAA